MRRVQLVLCTACCLGFLVVFPSRDGLKALTPPMVVPKPSIRPSAPAPVPDEQAAPPARIVRAIDALSAQLSRQEAALIQFQGSLERLDERLRGEAQGAGREIEALRVAVAALEKSLSVPDPHSLPARIEKLEQWMEDMKVVPLVLKSIEERVDKLDARKSPDVQHLVKDIENLKEKTRKMDVDRIELLSKVLAVCSPEPAAPVIIGDDPGGDEAADEKPAQKRTPVRRKGPIKRNRNQGQVGL